MLAALQSAPVELSWWEAVILGLVEGITEYLPVSSTGHLLATNEFLGLNETAESTAAADTFAICIQVGAILAVLVLYWSRIRQMLDGLFGRSEEGRKVLFAVIAAFIPTAIIGVFLRGFVKDRLFGLTPITIAWLVGGLIVLALVRSKWFDRAGHELRDLTVQHAALIGVAQAVALWPGVSRSLVTIIAGVAVGMRLAAAVEFSFLLGLLTLTAATVLEGADNGQAMLDTFGWVTPLIGLVVAFVSAAAAVRWMVDWLNKRGFAIFGWYRVAIGVLGLALIAANVLPGS